MEYSPEYEKAWAAMPSRGGANNPKAGGQRAFNARIRDGFTAEYLIAQAERYGDRCDADGSSGTEKAMQVQTFFGPNRPFEQEWEVPAIHSNGNGKSRWR